MFPYRWEHPENGCPQTDFDCFIFAIYGTFKNFIIYGNIGYIQKIHRFWSPGVILKIHFKSVWDCFFFGWTVMLSLKNPSGTSCNDLTCLPLKLHWKPWSWMDLRSQAATFWNPSQISLKPFWRPPKMPLNYLKVPLRFLKLLNVSEIHDTFRNALKPLWNSPEVRLKAPWNILNTSSSWNRSETSLISLSKAPQKCRETTLKTPWNSFVCPRAP